MDGMRNWVLVLGLLVACDDEAGKCENASGSGSSGEVASSSEEGSSSGEESTGEPAAVRTCSEELAQCYADSCGERLVTWYRSRLVVQGCTGGYPDCSYCGEPPTGDIDGDGDADGDDAEEFRSAMYYVREVVPCVQQCGDLDLVALEYASACLAVDPGGGVEGVDCGVENASEPRQNYCATLLVQCERGCTTDADCSDGLLCRTNTPVGSWICHV